MLKNVLKILIEFLRIATHITNQERFVCLLVNNVESTFGLENLPLQLRIVVVVFDHLQQHSISVRILATHHMLNEIQV